jgi:hypothetical protein
MSDEIWQEDVSLRGSEVLVCGRLLLAGCRFGRVDRTLNYRRKFAGRRYQRIAECYAEERRCQEVILDDARCPTDVRESKTIAFSRTCLNWCYAALLQEERELGLSLLREAVRFDPRLVSGAVCPLVDFWCHSATAIEEEDHEAILRRFISMLPCDLAFLSPQLSYSITEGYLLKGARAVIWGRQDCGRKFLADGIRRGDDCVDTLTPKLVHRLLDYRSEYGDRAAVAARGELHRCLEELGAERLSRRVGGAYHFQRALEASSAGKTLAAAGELFRAVLHEPNYLRARPAQRIFLRLALLGRRVPRRVGRLVGAPLQRRITHTHLNVQSPSGDQI